MLFTFIVLSTLFIKVKTKNEAVLMCDSIGNCLEHLALSSARNGTWIHFKNCGPLVSLDYLTGKRSHEGEKAILRRRLIAKVTWLKLYKYLLIKLRWFTVLTTYAFDWTVKVPVYFCSLPVCCFSLDLIVPFDFNKQLQP